MSMLTEPSVAKSDEPKDERLHEENINIENVKKKISKTEHICPYDGCNKSFKKPSRLTWHIRTHTGEKPYKCTFENCDRAYTTSSHLKRHIATHNPIQTCFECDVCKLLLRSKFSLSKHYRRAHENKDKLCCKECGVWFRKKSSFEDHIRLHKDTILNCDKCHKTFNSELKFRRHKKSHEIKYYCKEPGCDAKFEYLLPYRKHCETHEELDEKREKKLKSRLSAHNRNGATTLLACPYDQCHRVYYHQSNLNYHIRTKHEGIKKFECDLCKMRFASKRPMINHFKKFHNDVVEVQNKDDENQKDNNLKEPEKKKRRKRFDAGLPKRSITSKLIGIMLPHDMEKVLLKRDAAKKCSDKDFVDTENNVQNK